MMSGLIVCLVIFDCAAAFAAGDMQKLQLCLAEALPADYHGALTSSCTSRQSIQHTCTAFTAVVPAWHLLWLQATMPSEQNPLAALLQLCKQHMRGCST